MMEEKISNFIIAILAIAIVILGLLLIWRVPVIRMAGMATDTGTVSATVSIENSITITDAAVNLGTIITGQSNSSDSGSDWFVIENNGSVRIDLNMEVDETNLTAAASEIYCKCVSGSNQSGQCPITNYTNCESTEDGSILIATCLKDADAVDEVNAGVNLSVALTETAGAKTLATTFTATTNQSSSCTSS